MWKAILLSPVKSITNVTDRARYYSFYPWAIWAFEQLPGYNKLSEGALIEWVQRAGCLFTMIGIRHRITSGDDNTYKHDAALVGSQALRPVVSNLSPGQRLKLSTYTTREDGDPLRYFKNGMGGLGQYYIGTFDGIGLMKSSSDAMWLTRKRGESH